MLLSAFSGQGVHDLPHQSKPEEREMEIAFADNECAHALLLLSTAATQAALPQSTQSNKKRRSHGALDHWTTSSNAQCHQEPRGTNDSPSILKRQLQISPVKHKRVVSMGTYDGNTAVKIGENGENLRKLLIKRIRLDHNYATEEHFKNVIDNGRKHSSSETVSNGTDLGIPKRDLASSGHESPSPAGHKVQKWSRAGVSKGKASKGLTHASKPATGKRHDPHRLQEDVQKSSHRYLSLHTVQPDRLTPEPQPPDLYEPSDSKYKNFNLLLRCLTTEETLGTVPEEAPMLFTGRRRCNTIGSSTTTASTAQDSEDGLVTDPSVLPDYSEHQCKCCFKVFSRKRYLTKHVSRMHPEMEPSESDKEDAVSCPNCTHVISRKNFKCHSHMCNAHMKKSKKQLEMDLANCQFCGIRMRRHILVRHLAQEHCVENLKSASALLPADEGDISDSDSSTLSGNDNEDEKHSPGKDVLLCNLCNILVPRSLLKEHIQQSHPTSSKASSSTETSATSTSPGRGTLVSCQLCGAELSHFAFSKHLAQEHGMETKAEGHEVSGLDTNHSRAGCTHSMLQRFLSESSGDVDSTEPMDQCQSCINGLVKLATLATVNGSPQPGSDSPADVPLAPAAACALTRGSHSSMSVAHRSTGAVQDSRSERSLVI